MFLAYSGSPYANTEKANLKIYSIKTALVIWWFMWKKENVDEKCYVFDNKFFIDCSKMFP